MLINNVAKKKQRENAFKGIASYILYLQQTILERKINQKEINQDGIISIPLFFLFSVEETV